MQWNIFVEDLAVVTTYTSTSVSISETFVETGFYLIAVELFRVFEARTCFVYGGFYSHFNLVFCVTLSNTIQ